MAIKQNKTRKSA